MNNTKSKDIAFFNLLKGLVAPKLGNEALNYKITMSDLANKMELDHKIIGSFLKRLKNDGLVDFLDDVNGDTYLHFERTHDKLLELISIDAVEEKISNISDFIEKKIAYFDFKGRADHTAKYALEAKKLMDIEGEKVDLSDIISRGVKDVFSYEANRNALNKVIFEISKDADDEDLKTLEEIIYFRLNLPIEEDPFHVTLFLFAISFQIQYL
jgi:hypothetical protein